MIDISLIKRSYPCQIADIPLGVLKNESVRLIYENFTACLHQAEYRRQQESDFTVYCGHLTFHLDGFIHLVLTK